MTLNRPPKFLLIVDAAVNLLLGLLLLLFPTGIAVWLGAPPSASAFYPSILGGVLFGIGLALLLEARQAGQAARGLGINGAICINFCGAGVLAVWLMAAPPAVPLHGQILLWSIAIGVLVIGVIELLTGTWRN